MHECSPRDLPRLRRPLYLTSCLPASFPAQALTCEDHNRLRTWAAAGEPTPELPAHDAGITALAHVSRSSRDQIFSGARGSLQTRGQFCSGSQDGRVCVWGWGVDDTVTHTGIPSGETRVLLPTIIPISLSLSLSVCVSATLCVDLDLAVDSHAMLCGVVSRFRQCGRSPSYAVATATSS